MLELGNYAGELHAELGKKIIDNRIDILITIGKHSKVIAKMSKELGFSTTNIFQFSKLGDITMDFLSDFDNRDIVLIKGSHGMKLDRTVNKFMEEKTDE